MTIAPSAWSKRPRFERTSVAAKLFHERFSVVDLARYCRGPDGIFAGELDRTSPHRRSAAQTRFTRQLLEDVHDRDPTRRDPGIAGLFLETDPGISRHLSKRRTRRSQFPDASAQPDDDCVCGHGTAGMGIDQSDR